MLRVVCIAILTWIACVSPTLSQDLTPLEAETLRVYKLLPRASAVVRHPEIESWAPYGVDSSKTVKAASVPDGEAFRLEISRKGANVWDAGAQIQNANPIAAGDVISASFWARAVKIPDGEMTAKIPAVLQLTREPYDAFANASLELDQTWRFVSIYGEALQSYRPGEMALSLQIAGAKQTIDLGPAVILNLGPGAVDPSAMLPRGDAASSSGASSAKPAPSKPVAPVKLSRAIEKDMEALRSRLPAGARLVSVPSPNVEAYYGKGPARIVKDRAVPGGEALEVVTERAGLESWSAGVNWALTEDIVKDDVILVALWAKAIEARNESQTAAIQPIRVQQSAEPYSSAAEGVAYLSRDWALYYVPGLSGEDIEAGPAGLTFHLGLIPQTVRLGPAYVFKFPKGTDVGSLPRNEINYAGRDAKAPWRAAALARIDQYRKADLKVTVRDENGAPVPGATVSIRQLDHAFNFGSFTGHAYNDPETADEREWHRIFDANFNTATLPIYWQDWGWNGEGSNEARYRQMINYTTQRGLDWRAHPVIWPGEDYMPSRILAEMSPAKRRALVMNHIRDVVPALRDAAKAPIAVDMVNEVRVNRFFQENGDPTLVEDAFRLTHELAPDLRLFVNDYAILNNGGENRAAIAYYHKWIQMMRAKDLPLHGIGFQGHFSAGLTPPERLIEIMDGFAEYSLPLHITEFDVETLDEGAQADYTRDMVLAALSVPSVEAFIFWQFWEGDHWKPNAAMLEQNWTPKPAYHAWRDLVFGTFWTDTKIVTDALGRATIRGMRGRYEVQFGQDIRQVDLDGAETSVRF